MSQENERLAQEGMRAFNERDIEGLVAAMHPAAEIELLGGRTSRMALYYDRQETLEAVGLKE